MITLTTPSVPACGSASTSSFFCFGPYVDRASDTDKNPLACTLPVKIIGIAVAKPAKHAFFIPRFRHT